MWTRTNQKAYIQRSKCQQKKKNKLMWLLLSFMQPKVNVKNYYLHLLVNLNLFLSNKCNPWLFLRSAVPGWAVTISRVYCPLFLFHLLFLLTPFCRSGCVLFVLCSVNVFVKEMRVHDPAIPPVTFDLTAGSGPPPRTQSERDVSSLFFFFAHA